MAAGTLAEIVQQWAHLFLMWVGFGTLAGLLAKAIMPGRDPGGAVMTLLMGIGGTIIGDGVLMFFFQEYHVTPISFLGFLAATAGAFILLVFHRLLSGRFFKEGDYLSSPQKYAYPNRRRVTEIIER